ncbi:hypothetical protein BJ322DRAFT_1096740 [Thelephora terrestris]|uniref:F-box domain-containing protein n=1 Tax=Thelephora terrestris TaxID=56493 RepID=A0A9P6H1H3_9AGAM|nr:hypothetical protein BJ322DRAFT_1096740 [Thelephora terrestris]
MRTRRKAKDVDTAKAQKLIEVGGLSSALPSTTPNSPATVTGGRLPLELYGHIISVVDLPSTLRQILPCLQTQTPRERLVAIVLQSLTELENLDIYGQSRIQLQKLLDVTSPHLKRFRSSVLASRPGLRELVVPDSYPGFQPVVPGVFLPRLEILCLPMCLAHHITKMNCPLTHLAIDLTPYRDLESIVPGIISHFGGTLQNLSLVRLAPTQVHRLCPMIDLISEFAADVPKLRFLTISVVRTLGGPSNTFSGIETTNWKSFEALETLVWFAEDGVGHSVYIGEKFANAVYGTCAALTRFIFVNESKDFAGYRLGNDGARYELTDLVDVEPYIAPRAWRKV